MYVLPKGEERARTPPPPPWGEQGEILGKNLQEYPKPGATRFVTKRGIVLIGKSSIQSAKGRVIFENQT